MGLNAVDVSTNISPTQFMLKDKSDGGERSPIASASIGYAESRRSGRIIFPYLPQPYNSIMACDIGSIGRRL